jgi:large subunit ribosomal protein L10
VTEISDSGQFKLFEIKGGVMDNDPLTEAQVKAISKWPNRQEQIALLVGQILSPGANLSGQLVGGGRKLASQLKKII